MMRIVLVCFLSLFSVSSLAHKAAIAMPDKYSAEVAETIIKQGGNAIDASVAAAFVLAVTYPEAGNIGGGFMTIYATQKAKPGQMVMQVQKPYFLDYREKRLCLLQKTCT